MQLKTVSLPSELAELQEKWAQLDRREQDEFYANEFAPKFLPIFKNLELHGAPLNAIKPKFLVSVLGMSWQPIALMASWIEPERILIIGTQNSLRKDDSMSESPIERIARLAQLAPGQIEQQVVDEHREEEIYSRVREFVKKWAKDPAEVAVDPTGGKKAMSVSASLAGFMSGCQLVYVDCAIYRNRAPLAGTEFPRLLMNPLDVFGDAEFQKMEEAYAAGHFTDAAQRAKDLAARPFRERHRAELCRALCEAFCSWNDFAFDDAKRGVLNAIALLDSVTQFENRWAWSKELRAKLVELRALITDICDVCADYKEKAANQPIFMNRAIFLVLNHLSAARRVFEQKRYGIAAMLAYSTLEKYLDLLLLTHFGLCDESPDWSVLSPDQMVQIHATGRKIYKAKYEERDLCSQKNITLSLGFQVAAALIPSKFPQNIQRVNCLTTARNKCEFEHGIVSKPLDRETAEQGLDFVEEVLALHYAPGPEGREILEKELQQFEFPALPIH